MAIALLGGPLNIKMVPRDTRYGDEHGREPGGYALR
jgi:hypothetical protein